MTRCLMENENYKLFCDITHVNQMNDFLMEVSTTLKKPWVNKENCSRIECYKKDGILLHNCADLYYHLYVSQKDGVEMSSETLSKQLLQIFNCLKTAWPTCHASYSLLSIPFVHIPLGINLNFMVKKTPEKKCLYLKYPQIGNDLKCKEFDNEVAFDVIDGCLQEFIINLTKEHSFNSGYKLHWNVDPLNTCIMKHRIINCIQTQFHNFSVLVKDIVKNFMIQMNKYYNLFGDIPDLKQNHPCPIELSSSSVESCLFHLYDYTTNFDISQIKKSFPEKCLDDIFEGCYFKSTMHILIKKLLNVVDEDVNSMQQKFQSDEICMENKSMNLTGFNWAPCLTKNSGTYLSDLDHCMKIESVNQLVPSIHRNSSTLRTYEFCKKCLKMEQSCDFENNDHLMQSASLIIQCLKFHDIEGNCIMDASEKIKEVCSLDLYTCSQQMKSDTIMKALDACRKFHNCITQFVKECSINISETISEVYFQMLGLDFLPSIYKRSRLQKLI